MSAAGEHFQYAGWSFVLPDDGNQLSEYAREQLIAILLDTVAGKRGEPFLAGEGYARIGECSGSTNVLTGSGVDEAQGP